LFKRDFFVLGRWLSTAVDTPARIAIAASGNTRCLCVGSDFEQNFSKKTPMPSNPLY